MQTEALGYLTAAERAELDGLLGLAKPPLWSPDPKNKPQCLAYESTADVIGFGGAAGGGKTDLGIGKALTQHKVAMILRREGTQLTGIIDRITGILGNRDGYNGQDKIWRMPGLQLEFGSTPNPGDETRYQGRPHDLVVFDEAPNFLEAQVRFLLGWVRSVDPNQRCQALLCFNPPTSAEGRWIIDFFAPWLDDRHPLPAQPGELRYFAMLAGKEVEVPTGDPFMFDGHEITPKSRTFFPSRVTDNQYLMRTGYMATLQALPEPLRSQMLYGDFKAGTEDDAYQVIPTAWVETAMARWQPKAPKPGMLSLGVDVARGGKDHTVICRRHEGWWFDDMLVYPGTQTPDGPTVAGLAIAAVRNRSPIHVDVIGVGASAYDFLKQARQQVLGVNVAERSMGTDKSGRLTFSNLRSELWWRMRELLDPAADNNIALPNDRRLLIDLCAPKWRLSGAMVQVESREEIIQRIGRSPDYASALILATIDTPKMHEIAAQASAHTSKIAEHDPYANLIDQR